MGVICQSSECVCMCVCVWESGGTGPTFILIHLVSCHEHRQHKGRIEEPLWRGIMVMGTLAKWSKASCRYSDPAHNLFNSMQDKNLQRKMTNIHKHHLQAQSTCFHFLLYSTAWERATFFCHMNLFVHASGGGGEIISSDAQSILGTSQSAGNCAPSSLNTVHERAEWMMNLSLSMGLLECNKTPGFCFSPLFFVGGAAVLLKGRGDNWSWLFWCADNAIIRPNHIKGTLLGQQGPSSYSQDIGNTPGEATSRAVNWLWSRKQSSILVLGYM